MKTKKVPMRMCVLTHEKLPKKELLRIVISDNKIVGDLTGKLNGKGCYLKNKETESFKGSVFYLIYLIWFCSTAGTGSNI